MQDHGISDELISKRLHHANKRFRRQRIEENSAKKAFKCDKKVQNTRNDQMALDRSSSNQNKKKIYEMRT